MDIDTAPSAMRLDLPADEVMMEVDDFSAPPAPPPLRTEPASPAAASRSTPSPPAVQISTSDAPSCPKVKLDEFFVRFIASQDNHNFLTALLEDARAGKDFSASPVYRRLNQSAAQAGAPAALQPPGSPVSRLINAHTPFGEMSPRSPALSSAAARLAPGASGTSPEIDQAAAAAANANPAGSSPLAKRAISLTKTPETPASPIVETDKSLGAGVAAAAAGAAVIGAAGPAAGAKAAVDTDMTSDSTVHTKPANAEADANQSMSVAQPNGVADSAPVAPSLDVAAVKTGEDAVVHAQDGTTPSPTKFASKTDAALSEIETKPAVEKVGDEAAKATEATTKPAADSDDEMAPRDETLPPLPKPVGSPTVSDAQMTEPKKSLTIPRFYFPIGRDAETREKRELETIKEFFHIQRTTKNANGASKADIAELVVEVVGVPSYFASLIFSRIVDHYQVDAAGSVINSEKAPEPMSADSMRSSANDATMKDAGSGSLPNGDSTEAAAEQTATGPTPAAAATEVPGAQAQPAAEADGSNGGGAGVAQNGVPTNNGTTPPAPAAQELIREEQFLAFYERDCKGRSKEERLFRALLEPGADRDYLIPADFKPLLRALLVCHQGLAFLHATPEFQHRYSETVIERIYFGCTRRHNGRLTLDDIKRSKLLETLMVVDEEEDINRERKYFSYEHFYVLYCRFWELDQNHDLQIDREDLMRYGGHSLTFRIVDRIFGGHARPLDSPDGAGFLSYTDFIWFCLSEEDKTSETAIDYWFRCVDLDGDGLITMFDMEFFYQEQLHRMECFGHEPVQIRDILCQLLDMIKPNAEPPIIRRRDLKKCKLAGNFFNILFNLNKFFALEARDPLQIRQEHATPELTDWDRFAALEYLRLSAEEEGDEEEDWNDVADGAAPLMAGEAPF